MARGKRFVLPILAGVIVLFALLIGGAMLWANTASGRRFVADRIAAAVTDNIPGRLEIGEVTGIEWLALRARDVRFYHPDGRIVLQVDKAYVEPDALDALHAQLTFKRVVADGGTILMSGDPDGRLALEAAMDSPKRPGAPSDPKRGLHYDLRNMHVNNFTMKLKAGPLGEVRMSNISGTVHVWRLDTIGTRVRLTDLAGGISPEIAGAKLALASLDGLITGAEERVADVKARFSVDKDSALSLRVRYFPEQKQKVKVHVVDKAGTEATTLTWLLEAASSFSSAVSVEG